jgi:hypothetical protein
MEAIITSQPTPNNPTTVVHKSLGGAEPHSYHVVCVRAGLKLHQNKLNAIKHEYCLLAGRTIITVLAPKLDSFFLFFLSAN